MKSGHFIKCDTQKRVATIIHVVRMLVWAVGLGYMFPGRRGGKGRKIGNPIIGRHQIVVNGEGPTERERCTFVSILNIRLSF